jgi:hypothetical protein
MKKLISISAMSLVALVVLGTVYIIWRPHDRGLTADGHMAPPASVRNAPEAPAYDPAKSKPAASTGEKSPDYQLPTEFKLPTELDIETPPVPDDISAPANGQKS